MNTLVKNKFDFEGCREAYLSSIERLRKERVDVFIGNHTWNNNTRGKAIKLLSGDGNDFIDGKLWLEFLETYEKRLMKIISEDS